MHKSILLILIFFASSPLLSQEIDSLMQLLQSSDTLANAQKVAINLKLAKLHRRIKPDEQLKFARDAFKEASIIKDMKSQGIAMSEIGSHYQKADNYDSAYYYYEKGLLYFRSDKNIGNTYSRLSTIEKQRGNIVESITLLLKADSLYQGAGYIKGRLITNINLGITLSYQEEYQKSISYFKLAEKYLTDKDILHKINLFTNMATSYYSLADFTNAKKYLAKSIPIQEKLNDFNGLANGYIVSSAIERAEGNDIKSSEYMELAIKNYKKTNNKKGELGCYNLLGGRYREKGEYKKAEDYLQLAKSISNKIQNHRAALNNSREFYKLYNDQKLWEKAFVHLQDYTILKDSINEIDKVKITKELFSKYEKSQILKDKELAESDSALAQKKAEYNRIFAMTMAAIGGLILAFALFIFYRFKVKKKEEVLSLQLRESEKHLRLEQQTRVAELKALRSQMNPHFMFNALNSIQDLILLNDIRSSNKYLGKFGDLMRRVLNSSNAGTISITEEIRTLKLYAELEQLRFGERLEITFKNDLPTAVSDDYLLPVMLIQPIMENALKHGLLHKKDQKRLSIHFYMEQSMVVCAIDDNGIGREEAMRIKQKEKGDHLGFSTQAIQERIELLNAGRNQKIRTEIIDKKADNKSVGTAVFLYFPIEEL